MIPLGRSIFHKLLAWFVGVGVVLILIFGTAQFVIVKRQIQQELEQAARHALDEAADSFERGVVIPLESALRILERLSGLDEMLQAWGDKALLIKPNVERNFLHVASAHRGLFLSIRYFDSRGVERVAVADNRRLRDPVNLTDYTGTDPYYAEARALHADLIHGPVGALRFRGPFRMVDGRWTLLAGIPKRDPEIGELAGVVLIHGDLADFLRHIIDLRVWGHQGARLFIAKGRGFEPLDGGGVLTLGEMDGMLTREVRLGGDDHAMQFRMAFPLTAAMLHDPVMRALHQALVPLFLLLVIITGLAYRISRRLAAPIIELRRGMDAIGLGRFDTSIPVTTRDEIGELAETFNRMGRDLREMTRELSNSRAAAEEANRSKSLFLANMSHEIRTPMNAVIGLTDLALAQELSPKVHDYLRKISHASRSLLRIINDLLDYSKVDAGRLELDNIDFKPRELFDHLIELFRVQIAGKRITLLFSVTEVCQTSLHGDPLRLEQILMNLIGNAVKFTPEGGEVEVSVRRLHHAGEVPIQLHFKVRDTGIGITDEQAGRLFQPFSQADLSVTRTHGGSGLGLAICKRLVEMMNGRIWLESQPGVGSTFHFIARFQPAVIADAMDLLLPREWRGLAVLVVIAHPGLRATVEGMLRQFQASVVAVASVEAALARIGHARARGIDRPFRLAVLDDEMPEWADRELENRFRSVLFDGEGAGRVLRLVGSGQGPEGEILGAEGEIRLVKPVGCTRLFAAILELCDPERIRNAGVVPHDPDPNHLVGDLSGARVLLVEDNLINRQVAEENLVGFGIEVEMADNGQEAVQMVSTRSYDLVLMDVQMPVMDGLAAARLIRSDGRFETLPILAMTAHALEEDQRATRDAGMNGHISKPIRRTELLAVLREWLPSRHGFVRSARAWEGADRGARRAEGSDELLDRAGLLDRINHKQGLLRSLLGEFLRHFDGLPGTLRGMLEDGSPEGVAEARKRVHALKGSAGNLTAMTLFNAAQAFEFVLKQESGTAWWGGLERLEESLERTFEAIRLWLRELDREEVQHDAAHPDSQAPLDRAWVTTMMREMDLLLARQDLASQDLMESLVSMLGRREESQRLEEAIDRLEFTVARVELQALAERLGVVLER
ncbi:Sensor histidine kinase RcsC [Candidatus Magnetaquicoccaceae bacterium FCR-1]|uniref:histidine kinase n=1 Tax=Candidatus Magnetaquiglobus chichijimensis TaxID=3141448 RepID=A0ABQ0C5N7_9PROT